MNFFSFKMKILTIVVVKNASNKKNTYHDVIIAVHGWKLDYRIEVRTFLIYQERKCLKK